MIIIIGGTGFLGKHLCSLLHKENIPAITVSRNPDHHFLKVNAPSIKSVKLDHQGLITDENILINASTVIYLASQTTPACAKLGISHELNTSVKSAQTILDQIVKINPDIDIKYVSSGGTIYGNNHSKPVSETSSLIATTPYAYGKICIEHYIKYLSQNTGCTYTIFRLANPVGKWHKNICQGLVGAALTFLKAGKKFTIYGDGSSVRDYIDADEAMSAIVESIKNPAVSTNNVWNVGSSRGYSINETLVIIETVTEIKLHKHFSSARNSDLLYNVLNTQKIQSELQWSASHDMQYLVRHLWLNMNQTEEQ